MTKKYVLHPGWMTSKSDKEDHFISAAQLARLYNIPMSECEVIHWDTDDRERELKERLWKDLIHLYPRYFGDYTLPNKE